MSIHRQRTRLAACCLLLSLGAAVAFAQDKVRLKDAGSRAGDAYTAEDTFSMAVNLVGKVDGQELPPLPFSNRERKAYQETVLSATPKSVTGFRRTYTVHRQAEEGPDGKKETVSSLQGKTITAKKVNGKPVITVAKGKIKPEDRKELADDLQESDMPDFLPPHPVGPGDEWDVDAQKLKTSFGLKEGPDEASIKGRFEEIVQRGGHRCARIHVVLKMTGKLKDTPMQLGVELTGDLYHSMDINQMLELNIRGPVTMDGTANEGGKEIVFTGTGSAQMKAARKFTRVAGKPVK